MRGGEHVSLLGSGVAPMHGRLALSRVAEMLERVDGSAGGLPQAEQLPRHAQLVLFGDFLAPLEAVNATVAEFASAGLKGHLLHVIDPAEEDMPFAGRVRFAGVEERDEVVIPRVEGIRGDYAQRFARHRDGLAAIARAVGWGYGMHRTDRPPHLALLALYTALSVDRRR